MLPSKRFLKLLIILISLLLCIPAVAEQARSRPKIGLVLAGGGALGFSHVGVLKVLEENRVPVHMVAGTSMGSIVGAAYAAGVPVDEMAEVLSSTDWGELFKDKPPRKDLAYRIKPGRDREIFGDAKISIKDGSLQVPQGLIQGQHILPLFRRLYGAIETPTNFDTLPLPFRAVAADIETGETVILAGGDLAKAVRASMAVPGVFSPVEIDGRILVDGGIVKNLPVDVVQQMGADVLIVVDFESQLKNRKELQSLFSISGQVITFLTDQNVKIQRQLIGKRDIIIMPDISEHTSADFAHAKALMAQGEKAARGILPKLKSLSLNPSQYDDYRAHRSRVRSSAKIDFVRLENESSISDGTILRELRVNVGDELDRSVIEEDIRRIYNLGYFSSVEYVFAKEAEKEGLVISATGKNWSEQFMRIGLSLEDDFEGNAFYSLGLNYRINELNRFGGELDIKGEFGRNPRLELEFHNPLGKDNPFFVAPVARISRTDVLIRQNEDTIAEYERTEMFAGITAGREIYRKGEMRVGYLRGFGDFDLDIGDPELPEFDYDIGEAFAEVVLDTLDTPDFPTSGSNSRLGYLRSSRDLGANSGFEQLVGTTLLPVTWGRNTIALGGSFATTFGQRPVERFFSLGGFLDVSGFEKNSLFASDYIVGRLLGYRRFSEVDIPLFGLGFFAGGSLEVSNLTSDFSTLEDSRTLSSGSLFIGADTPVIPVYLGIGLAEGGQVAGYFTLGRLGVRRR